MWQWSNTRTWCDNDQILESDVTMIKHKNMMWQWSNTGTWCDNDQILESDLTFKSIFHKALNIVLVCLWNHAQIHSWNQPVLIKDTTGAFDGAHLNSQVFGQCLYTIETCVSWTRLHWKHRTRAWPLLSPCCPPFFYMGQSSEQ